MRIHVDPDPQSCFSDNVIFIKRTLKYQKFNLKNLFQKVPHCLTIDSVVIFSEYFSLKI